MPMDLCTDSCAALYGAQSGLALGPLVLSLCHRHRVPTGLPYYNALSSAMCAMHTHGSALNQALVMIHTHELRPSTVPTGIQHSITYTLAVYHTYVQLCTKLRPCTVSTCVHAYSAHIHSGHAQANWYAALYHIYFAHVQYMLTKIFITRASHAQCLRVCIIYHTYTTAMHCANCYAVYYSAQ